MKATESEGAVAFEKERRSRSPKPSAKSDPNIIGRTMFDSPGSEDMTLTVLLSQDRVQVAPSQSMVRIKSDDKRSYLGVVEAGPFAEPDSLRADSPILLAVATQQAAYLPRYHGRIQVKLLGEEVGGSMMPPRLRPLPHSPVYLLPEEETADVLKCGGDIRLGLAVGHTGIVVGVPSSSKDVLPRHTAVLGTTGGGKTTTVSGLIKGASEAGMAVVVLDVEGEYTRLHEPNAEPRFVAMLKERGVKPSGVEKMSVAHLVGRDTTNPKHPALSAFCLQFARLSPYAAMAMLDLNEAQGERYLFAYDVAKEMMRSLGIFPKKGVATEELARQERIAERLDEFERGYPRLTLSFLLDIVEACKAKASKSLGREPWNDALKSDEGKAGLKRTLDARDVPGNVASWGKVQSVLWRLHRLGVFDNRKGGALPLIYKEMLKPGQVTVIDLSDAGMSELSNIAVADVLRGLQEEQDRAFREKDESGVQPPRVLIVLEEAHEFLGADRIKDSPHLYEQVSRLAKRGRKRWLGLCLVTQLPQHLPRNVLAMCNNFILHKITDENVIASLKHTVSGVDGSLWSRLPGLSPGQAVVAMGHLSRPVLASIDPPASRLRMTE